MNDLDARFMQRAIELSRRGFPAPNPHVGSVIVQGEAIVGEGWHEYAGAPHGEAAALIAAGGSAKGATAYITLEPCNHHGRVGPCSEALIQAGVKRVVYACADPNPKAAGGGERLRQAGIQVESGLLADEAAEANRQFLFAMAHRRPYIVLKAACSLDGRVALPSGESKWITGPEAREEGHRLRVELGAVLVGRRTVELDDPQLTARIPGVRNQPTRIVLDPNGKLKGSEKVFDDQARTFWVREAISLQALVSRLFEEGITGLLVEGGPTTIGTFLAADLYERIELFLAPKILGSGPTWAKGFDISHLTEAKQLVIEGTQKLGDDLRISLRRP